MSTVLDFTPAQLRRQMKQPPTFEAPQAAFSIYDDLADGIEAFHQCSTLAGFSERPRNFILALVTAARTKNESSVELYDDDLAELMNCSTRTIRRGRADYQREAKARNFGFVEIDEGEFNKEKLQYAPTRYTLHLEETIEQIVTRARASSMWRETDRLKQREAIKFYASKVYDEIPEAPPGKKRKPRRPRLATSEIETCQKIIDNNLKKIQDVTANLPYLEQERLLDDPGDLRQWYLAKRAEMDAYFGVDSSQTSDNKGFDPHTGQTCPVSPPPTPEPVRAGATADPQASLDEEEQPQQPECVRSSSSSCSDKLDAAAEDQAFAEAAWEETFGCLNEPRIKRVEVRVRSVEALPDEEDSDQSDPTSFDDFTVEPDPPEEVRRGLALWHNADSDVLVTVTADMGVGPDGRRYVAIEESRTGVPFDEIEFPDCDETAEEWAIRMEGCGPPAAHAEYEEVF